MKVSEAPSKIIGVTLGEISVSILRPEASPFKARFALISKEGGAIGFMDMDQWSERAIEALKTFQNVLEEEALARISEVTPAESTTSPEKRNEPQQF